MGSKIAAWRVDSKRRIAFLSPFLAEAMRSDEEEAHLDEVLGRVRCARCGQVLEGEVECPFCSLFPDPVRTTQTPAWVYLTACFLTSPLSLPFLLRSRRFSPIQKILSASGLLVWAVVYWML